MFVIPKVDEIKRRRLVAGLAMKPLSEKANLPANAILRIESGATSRVNHLRAEAIAAALGCDVKEIFQYPDRDKVG